jgi:signal recognition particle subunit SRP54
VDEKQLSRIEAIVLSMTPGERKSPDILNARRRQRIARGSGTSVTEVNTLLQRFSQMRKLMKNAGQLKKMLGRVPRAGASWMQGQVRDMVLNIEYGCFD